MIHSSRSLSRNRSDRCTQLSLDSLINRIKIGLGAVQLTLVVLHSDERSKEVLASGSLGGRRYLTMVFASVRSATWLLFVACLRMSTERR